LSLPLLIPLHGTAPLVMIASSATGLEIWTKEHCRQFFLTDHSQNPNRNRDPAQHWSTRTM